MMDRCIDEAVKQILKVSATENCTFIRYYVGFELVADLIKKRKYKFTNSLVARYFDVDHSFSLSLQAQNLPFQQILPTLDFFYLLDCLTITGPDWTYYAHHFIFSFTF